jgi:hypothetical protein
MNVSTALTTLAAAPLAAATAPAAGGALAQAAGLPATAARDAAMPDFAATTASTNSLQTLAVLLAGQSPSTSAFSSGSSASASASDVAIAAPPLPSAVDHGSHDETALHEDLGLADDAAADPSQASISV